MKKVSPQGPAAATVNIGDKITSITIDFQHIVHEDASTILSYASPYNVQLELIDGRGVLPASTTQSPTFGQQTLTHPLYRSSSQDDFNTIERNARKKLFPNGTIDDGNYSTMLKMEQQQQQQNRQSTSPPRNDVVLMHKENEKKSPARQIKELIEDKLLAKSNSNASTKQPVAVSQNTIETDDTGKGLKFGIRVLPMIDTPSKLENDNENNANQVEKQTIDQTNEATTTLPIVNKRTKTTTTTMKTETTTTTSVMNNDIEFQRQGSITSSGIRRDAAGIPQEIPNQMMQAALAAKDNRKSLASSNAATTADDGSKKSKGKAPNPPPTLLSDDDVTDAAGSAGGISNTQYTMLIDDMDIGDSAKNLSDTSSPISDRKIMGSDTESHLAGYDHGKFLENHNYNLSCHFVLWVVVDLYGCCHRKHWRL